MNEKHFRLIADIIVSFNLPENHRDQVVEKFANKLEETQILFNRKEFENAVQRQSQLQADN